MLKFSDLVMGSSIALLPFLSTVLPARAVDISPSTGFSGSAIAGDSNLVCYMHTTDGRILNLNQICGSNVNGSNRSTRPAIVDAVPVGNLGGLAVDQAPGTPACYGLDAQGLPC